MVAVCAALVLPTEMLPKANVAGESATGATAVPVRLTICGELDAVSAIVMAPEMLPVVVGENVELTMQLAPAASDVPQLLVWVKSPLDVMEMVVDAPPVFFTVTGLLALLVPTACDVNVSALGVAVTVTPPPAVPVPVRFTV